MNKRISLRFRQLSDGRVFEVDGRVAQTIDALVAAGARGVTALEISSWALRLAHYIFLAKKLGLEISMELEPHDGGRHGRYRLLTAIQILETEMAGT
jgi:hypothetical protein